MPYPLLAYVPTYRQSIRCRHHHPAELPPHSCHQPQTILVLVRLSSSQNQAAATTTSTTTDSSNVPGDANTHKEQSHMSTKALTRIRAQEVDLGGKFLQRIEIRMITFRVFQKSFSCLSGCGCRCNLSATYGHTFRVGRMRQTKARREMNAIL